MAGGISAGHFLFPPVPEDRKRNTPNLTPTRQGRSCRPFRQVFSFPRGCTTASERIQWKRIVTLKMLLPLREMPWRKVALFESLYFHFLL